MHYIWSDPGPDFFFFLECRIRSTQSGSATLVNSIAQYGKRSNDGAFRALVVKTISFSDQRITGTNHKKENCILCGLIIWSMDPYKYRDIE